MKILHVIDNIQGGGKEQRMIQLSKGLVDRGIEVEILLLENRIDYLRVENLNIKIHTLQGNPKNYFNVTSQLFQKIRIIDPTIVQLWGSLVSSVFVSFVAFRLGCKIVGSYVTVSKPIPVFHKHFLPKKINFLLSDVIVSNSKAGLDAFKVPVRKRKLIYNGFDDARLQDLKSIDSMRQTHGIKKKFIVIMAARFSNHKDYSTYLEAAKIVYSKNKNVAFLCLGKGETLSHLKSEYASESVYFLGFQENSLSYLNMCDISVLCTNNKKHLEGVSNSIIESMFLGKPIIATKGGGTNEVIVNDSNGFLINPYDPMELSENILKVLDDYKMKNRLGMKSKEDAHKKFRLKDKVDEYVEVYRNLV